MVSNSFWVRACWFLIGVIGVCAVFTAINLGFKDVRVESKTVTTTELPKTYDAVVDALGEGQPVDPASIGATGMTVCGQWAVGEVAILACK